MDNVEHISQDSSSEEFFSENGLTPIPHRIHWAATQDRGGSELDELDEIAINNFLDTLAEIAISIAAREPGITAREED